MIKTERKIKTHGVRCSKCGDGLRGIYVNNPSGVMKRIKTNFGYCWKCDKIFSIIQEVIA